MTTGHGKTISYAYDDLKRLTGKNVINGAKAVVAHAYAYKSGSESGTTTSLVEYHNVRTKDDSLLTGAKYTYDALGNITGIYESVLVGTNTERRPLATYEYDDQNQLEKEEIYTYASSNLTANPSKTTTYTYTYDTAGNILTATGNGATKTYAYNDIYWGDKLTAFNGMTISYDGVGNITGYDNGQYSYDLLWEHGRQLSYIALDDGDWQHAVEFNYDADGIRTSKTFDGLCHNYLTQSGKVVRETIGSGSTAKVLDFIYDESGKPFALIYKNGTAQAKTYYYVLNYQGDVVKLVEHVYDTSTQKYVLSTVASYTYNAWGEILTATGTMAEINPLRYRGYYYDSETGWYYLQSRYYDPALHRFINADSIYSTGQGFIGTNMFAYCLNNPVVRIDAAGTVSIWGLLYQCLQFGFVHWAVQLDIKSNYGVSIELWMTGKTGRADIYDLTTGYVWEVKHGMHNIGAAQAQLKKYKGKTTSRFKAGVATPGPAGAFNGEFDIVVLDNYYHVTYQTPADGVVIYEVHEVQKQAQPKYGLVKTPEYVKREQYSYGYGGKYGLVTPAGNTALLGMGMAVVCGFAGMMSSHGGGRGFWERMFR